VIQNSIEFITVFEWFLLEKYVWPGAEKLDGDWILLKSKYGGPLQHGEIYPTKTETAF
jgi:hypothetical protein